MRHLECRARQRPARRIPAHFVGSNPPLPRMMTAHILPARIDRITLDRLPRERIAARRPVLQRSRFKIQIQRLPLRIRRQNTFSRFRTGAQSGGRQSKHENYN